MKINGKKWKQLKLDLNALMLSIKSIELTGTEIDREALLRYGNAGRIIDKKILEGVNAINGLDNYSYCDMLSNYYKKVSTTYEVLSSVISVMNMQEELKRCGKL